ncbi:choice-of-anchor M domain-containing protein [Phytohabitans kaempferiae]|uniref:Choice-of-anchor M domain-containing protein n=1 Tax=Phytohabitans kaempferiae TaxID=1620943 RepID=A0ABV6M8G1_9ACTN
MSIGTSKRPRRAWVGLTALLLATGSLFVVSSSGASAAPGPAPDPQEFRVLEKVHTDAVATFLDDGVFALGTLADLPEGNGVRLDPASVWFHVDDASKVTLPAGREFVGPGGSEAWIAPESNPSGNQLWPGFSTERVPVDGVDGNTTTLRLSAVTGPGDVEVFTSDAFGAVTRLWSSDERIDSFEIGRTHKHANWAFTSSGTYRLTIEATAARSGEPVSASATYTFVVGGLPETVTTATTLDVSATEVTVGEDVELTATVSPASVGGFLEFRAGATALGHVPVEDGQGSLSTPLALGTHPVTAHFVPEVTNLTAASTSEPVDVTVVDASGVPFSVTGVSATPYQPGDAFTAQIVGATLAEGQQFRWLWRHVGSTSTGRALQTSTSPTLSTTISALEDDHEISVAIRQGNTVVAQTPWVPFQVEHLGGQPTLTRTDSSPTPLLPGDVAELVFGGRELGEGETLEWGSLYAGATWLAMPPNLIGNFDFSFPDARTSRLKVKSTSAVVDLPYAARVVKDGLVVARTPLETITFGPRELQVQGYQLLYREGGSVSLDATVYPVREGYDDFTYTWVFTKDGVNTIWGEEHQSTPRLTKGGLTVADHHGGTLRLHLYNRGELAQQTANLTINITDDLETQIIELSTLAGHYHQGDAIQLNLTVDPAPADGDRLVWEWLWPGTDDWTRIPGAEGNRYSVTAEQALDDVQVRARLIYADPEVEPAASDARTIYVDDHGAAPRQRLSISGETAYPEGDTVTLTAAVSPDTVLTTYQWQRKAAGAEEFVVIPDQAGAELSFTAAMADSGAEYRVAMVKPDGQVVYGPSPATTLTVTPGTEPEPVTSLGVSGVADHYQEGHLVTLVAKQDPVTELDDYHWFTRAAGTDEWVAVPGALTDQYSFTATAAHDGTEVLVRLYDEDHNQVAQSAPVTIHLDDQGPEPPGDGSQQIIAIIPERMGALVISVNPQDNAVLMSDFTLAATGDRLTSAGQLRPVTVTDTRTAKPGWSASGQVSDFIAAGQLENTLAGRHLGWTPVVVEQPENGAVTQGAVVVPGLESGTGLATANPLATAPAGSGTGTSILGAELLIEAPTTQAPGTYQATITFTLI